MTQEQTKDSSRMSRFGFKKPRIFPPVWLLFALLAMLALDRWLPIMQLYPSLPLWSVWLLIVPGLMMALIAIRGFKRADTGAIPFSKSTTLVTDGIYRYTRNPMYLGMALVLVAVAVRLGSLSAWLPIPVFIGIIQHQFIRNEEIFLTAIYGDEYRQFCARVRTWF
jgi:protein-S-isoprenylcysteine O-methyltransferase Ste14